MATCAKFAFSRAASTCASLLRSGSGGCAAVTPNRTVSEVAGHIPLITETGASSGGGAGAGQDMILVSGASLLVWPGLGVSHLPPRLLALRSWQRPGRSGTRWRGLAISKARPAV